MVYHPVLLPQHRAKDGIITTTQYRPASAIHAFLLYVSYTLFTSGEMEIPGIGIFVLACLEMLYIAVLCNLMIKRGVKCGRILAPRS